MAAFGASAYPQVSWHLQSRLTSLLHQPVCQKWNIVGVHQGSPGRQSRPAGESINLPKPHGMLIHLHFCSAARNIGCRCLPPPGKYRSRGHQSEQPSHQRWRSYLTLRLWARKVDIRSNLDSLEGGGDLPMAEPGALGQRAKNVRVGRLCVFDDYR